MIFEAIVSLTLITLALAIFGCSLALAISVRATKTHEVLMAVYGVESRWILGPLGWELLLCTGVLSGVPSWYVAINPFVLAWAPYAWPNYVSVEWIAGALGGIMVLSVGLVAYAVLRLLRKPGPRRAGREPHDSHPGWAGSMPGFFGGAHAHPWTKILVLWRVASRPTSWLAVVVWGLFVALSIAGMAIGMMTIVDDYENGCEFLILVSGIHATFGMLLVSLFSPTVLAEERVRGSLDVMMTTPLPTDRIVMAKWWAAYRVVPALAILPAIGCLLIAAGAVNHPLSGRINRPVPAPLDAADYVAYVCIPVAMLLAQGAVVTSVGLALATWIRRVGRAVAVSVTCCAFFAFGWIILVELGIPVLQGLGLAPANNRGAAQFIVEVLATACPAGGQIMTFTTSPGCPHRADSPFTLVKSSCCWRQSELPW